MATATQPLLSLTASDLMTREVVTIPQSMSLRAAARVLFQNQIGGAPVVDADGHCVGILCATDFVHWTKDGAKGAEEVPLPTCPYKVKGRLLTGDEAIICILAPGSCPFQEMRPTTGGRHAAVCLQPNGVASNWQKVTKNLPVGAVQQYMTTDIVTAGHRTPLSELARMMIDAHIHHIIVVDDQRRPVGIVSTTDLVAALAHANEREEK
jgi:CBS domain-containing protein